MGKYVLILSFLFSITAGAQVSPSFTELRTIPKPVLRKYIGSDSASSIFARTAKGMNYLLPLYKSLYYEKEKMGQDMQGYYEDLNKALAFVGDLKSITELKRTVAGKPSDEDKADIKKMVDSVKAVYADAHDYILSKTRNNRVVMINEAADNPQHRVFTASLLEDLFTQGFRYLAMEMLYNRGHNLTRADATSGLNVCEPMAADLIRKALEIGYIVVPYEDTVFTHTVKQREYAQAENLAALLKKDPSAKMIVYAGYSHIDKAALTNDYIPMAAYFKIITRIDPLTINQTNMSEGSTDGFGTEAYRQWIRKHPVQTSSVVLIEGKSADITGSLLNDIYVLHPPNKYTNERPVWMLTAGRKEIPLSAAYRSAFMVQAYLRNEYVERPSTAVPVDQTYSNATNGIYYLYLPKGIYKLVYKDKGYATLGVKDIEVK